MKTAILNPRVSSDDQAKGYSLDIQEKTLREYCRKNNIEVVAVFREDHSAKNFNRPQFKKLLQYLQSHKGKIDFPLVTAWDRFSRDMTEALIMIKRLKGYGVQVRACEQPVDFSIPESIITLSTYLAVPESDNKRRGLNIQKGMKAAKEAGRWSGAAPYGYKNARDEQLKPIIIPSDKAVIVKKIFNEIAKGKSQSELRNELKEQGINLASSTFSDLLRNRVYTGEIFVRGDQGGYYVAGLHKPLIDVSTFQKVQQTLETRLQKKEFVKAKSFKEEFVLRGLLLCGHCLKKLTGSTSRGRSAKYSFYHCNHCKKMRLRVADVHDRVESILAEIKITKEAKKLFDVMVRKILMANAAQKRPERKIREELNLYERRISNIEDDMADRKIDVETFNGSLRRYRTEVERLQQELKENQSEETLYQKYVKAGIHVLEKLLKVYQRSTVEAKRKIIG